MSAFAYPYVLLALMLVPVLWWYETRRAARPALRYSSLATLHAAGGATRRPLLLPLLRCAAAAALLIALARPQRADVARQVYAEGIAIQMVLDVSGSMSELDMSRLGSPPQMRLDIVKDVFQRFVAGDGRLLPGRPEDLIGMIRFARYADSVCPPTLDHDNLLALLKETDIVRERAEDGTAIGDALALAVERLRDIKRTSGRGNQHTIRSRVIILLTDGEHNAGELTPEQAGDLAAALGIKVYTIMAGSGRASGLGVVPVDDSPLRHIASVTGGQHYRARSAGALASIYGEIDQLERTRTEERRFVTHDERYRAWAVAAFALIALHQTLAATWLRRIP
jgi:Ca-activated chloride channel family protein